jgi:hypothetical protein
MRMNIFTGPGSVVISSPPVISPVSSPTFIVLPPTKAQLVTEKQNSTGMGMNMGIGSDSIAASKHPTGGVGMGIRTPFKALSAAPASSTMSMGMGMDSASIVFLSTPISSPVLAPATTLPIVLPLSPTNIEGMSLKIWKLNRDGMGVNMDTFISPTTPRKSSGAQVTAPIASPVDSTL